MKKIILFFLLVFNIFYTFSQTNINYLLDINPTCYIIYHEQTGYTVCFKTNESQDYYLAIGSKEKLRVICEAALLVFEYRQIPDVKYIFKGSVKDYLYQFTSFNDKYITITDNHLDEINVSASHFIDILDIIDYL